MNHENVHSAGFYAKYPEVTWDLAEERWLGVRFPNRRSDLLIGAVCMTCGWSAVPHPDLALVLVKRRQVTELIIESQHWYQCPGDPRVKFWWLGEMSA